MRPLLFLIAAFPVGYLVGFFGGFAIDAIRYGWTDATDTLRYIFAKLKGPKPK